MSAPNRDLEKNPKYQIYLDARKKFDPAFDAVRAEHWPKWLRGEITHEQYRALIDDALTEWTNNLEPAWVAAGGTKNGKRTSMKEAQANWDAKWRVDDWEQTNLELAELHKKQLAHDAIEPEGKPNPKKKYPGTPEWHAWNNQWDELLRRPAQKLHERRIELNMARVKKTNRDHRAEGT